MASLSLNDRIVACLLGGAVGDAIGAHWEGRDPPTDFQIPERLYVTDDTQLTLATCETIMAVGKVDAESIANSFLRWFRERRLTGLGSATLKALTELDAGGHWALVGASGERAAGNGAATRIAPLAFLLDPDVDADRQTLRDVCRITHRNDEAYIGALAIVRAIRSVLRGTPLDNALLAALAHRLPDSRVRDRLVAMASSPLSISQYAAKFGNSGFVVDSVPCALLAATNSAEVLATMEQIVRCGGDTDSIAAMYGQIAGAATGTSAMPSHIAERIDEIATMRELFERFSRACDRNQ